MAAKKRRNKIGREEALATTAQLNRMGYTETDIAKKLGVSQPQVSYDIKKIKERYRDAILQTRHAIVIEKLETLQDIRKGVTEEFQHSKALQKVVTEKEPERKCLVCQGLGQIAVPSGDEIKVCDACKGKGKTGGVVKRTETAGGDYRAYYSIILDTLKQERELLGLDEATKIDVKTTGWDEVLDEVSVSVNTGDIIEAEIIKALPAPNLSNSNGPSTNGDIHANGDDKAGK